MKTKIKSTDTLRAIIAGQKLEQARKVQTVDRTTGVVAAVKYLTSKGVRL